MNKNWIWITHQLDGVHNYPNAPEQVDFLRNKHRHTFMLKIWIEVFNNDRDIEFYMFKDFIKSRTIDGDYGSGSCEEISDNINLFIKERYPNRNVMIDVSEEGIQGSFKFYENYFPDRIGTYQFCW